MSGLDRRISCHATSISNNDSVGGVFVRTYLGDVSKQEYNYDISQEHRRVWTNPVINPSQFAARSLSLARFSNAYKTLTHIKSDVFVCPKFWVVKLGFLSTPVPVKNAQFHSKPLTSECFALC